jgi:hypothetical protein
MVRGAAVKKSRVEMKVELMQHAEAIIDELLEWHEANQQPDFTQIETKVLELREKLSVKMTCVTLEGQAAVYPVPGPHCPSCQREMRYKGMKDNTLGSWVGQIPYSRAYYYCDDCKRGFFPPGRTT